MRFSVSAAILAASFSFLLGIFALIQNYKGTQNRKFALFNIALALWNVGEISSVINDQQLALYVYRFSYIGASFIGYYVATFFWSIVNCQSPRIERLMKWSSITFAALSPTYLIIQNIKIDSSQLTPIEEIQGPMYYLFITCFVLSLAYSVVPLISVYRKSAGYMRNQLRYIFAALCVGFLAILSYLASQFYDSVPPLYCFVQMCVSAIFATAILKHRLMDITVIIRKTLIYSGVMSILAIVYIVIVTLFTRIFEGLTGYQTVFTSAVGALLVTAGFQPLSKRVQTFIDAKFFRQYVDREEKLYELSREVITHTTPEAMAKSLIRVLADTLHPKSTALYLRARDGNGFVLVSEMESQKTPLHMPESNSLTKYFQDHPQPFVQQTLQEKAGESMDTRRPQRTENAA